MLSTMAVGVDVWGGVVFRLWQYIFNVIKMYFYVLSLYKNLSNITYRCHVSKNLFKGNQESLDNVTAV